MNKNDPIRKVYIRGLARNVARYKMELAGYDKHINKRVGKGRSFFALNWRSFAAEPLRPKRVKSKKPTVKRTLVQSARS